MSRINSLGGGLQTEMTAIRLKMAHVQKKQAAAHVPAPVAPLPTVHRKVLAFKPKMPAVSKKVAKPPSAGGKTRVVLKVKVKSPALQKRLGI